MTEPALHAALRPARDPPRDPARRHGRRAETPELVRAVSRAGGLGVLGVTTATVGPPSTATRAALALAAAPPSA